MDREDVEPEASSFGSSPWGGRPAPFAFAQLVERKAPSRRLVLSASAEVFAVTRVRNKENGPRPKATVMRSLPANTPPGGALVSESRPLPASALFAYGAALLVVLTLFWAVVAG